MDPSDPFWRGYFSRDLVKFSSNHFTESQLQPHPSAATSHAHFGSAKKGWPQRPRQKISHQKGGYRLPSLGGQLFLQSSRLNGDVGAMLLSSTGCWIGGSEVNKVNFVKHFQKETSHVFILWVFQGCRFGPKNQAAKPWFHQYLFIRLGIICSGLFPKMYMGTNLQPLFSSECTNTSIPNSTFP